VVSTRWGHHSYCESFHGLLGHLTWVYAIISFGVTSK
jgi:hypothetical protein